jgi:hypothetical protein
MVSKASDEVFDNVNMKKQRRYNSPAQPFQAPGYTFWPAPLERMHWRQAPQSHTHPHCRRREKNRASAQQSRQRKKCHLETLEQRVHELEQVPFQTLS